MRSDEYKNLITPLIEEEKDREVSIFSELLKYFTDTIKHGKARKELLNEYSKHDYVRTTLVKDLYEYSNQEHHYQNAKEGFDSLIKEYNDSIQYKSMLMCEQARWRNVVPREMEKDESNLTKRCKEFKKEIEKNNKKLEEREKEIQEFANEVIKTSVSRIDTEKFKEQANKIDKYFSMTGPVKDVETLRKIGNLYRGIGCDIEKLYELQEKKTWEPDNRKYQELSNEISKRLNKIYDREEKLLNSMGDLKEIKIDEQSLVKAINELNKEQKQERR